MVRFFSDYFVRESETSCAGVDVTCTCKLVVTLFLCRALCLFFNYTLNSIKICYIKFVKKEEEKNTKTKTRTKKMYHQRFETGTKVHLCQQTCRKVLDKGAVKILVLNRALGFKPCIISLVKWVKTYNMFLSMDN